MKDIDKELDEILTNLHSTIIDFAEIGAGNPYAEKDQTVQAIKQLINQARIDELNGYCKFLNDKPADSIVYATELMDRYLDRLKELKGE